MKECQGPCGREARLYSSRKGVEATDERQLRIVVAQREAYRDACCRTSRQRNPYVGTDADCAPDGANMVLGWMGQ
jgi:hypothetical protein